MDASTIINEVKSKQTNPVKLISAVKKHPCIWNSSCPDYRSKLSKQQAWNAVGNETVDGWKELNRTEKHICLRFILRRWNNIRDYYNRSLKANARAKITGVSFRKEKYVYADSLTFLNGELQKNINISIQELQDSSEFKIETLDTEEEETLEGVEEEEEGPEFVTYVERFDNCEEPDSKKQDALDLDEKVTLGRFSGQLRSRPSNATKMKKRKISKEHEVEEEEEAADDRRYEGSDAGSSVQQETYRFVKMANESTSTKHEDDPDLMFLKSLLPDMKKLADDEKFAFKFAIMQAYMDIVKKRV